MKAFRISIASNIESVNTLIKVLLLCEGDKLNAYWFRGKNRRYVWVSQPYLGALFCVLPLEIIIVDTEIMATIEMNRNRSNVSNFGQFMADLRTEKAYVV